LGLINNDEYAFALVERVAQKVSEENLKQMLEILLHLTLLSAKVKVRIVESGLTEKIIFILENIENAKEDRAHELILFSETLNNVSELDFSNKSPRFCRSFWDVVSRLYFLVDKSLMNSEFESCTKKTIIGRTTIN
jgi:hypothetical protein